MNRFLSQLLYMPVTVFVATLDMMGKMLRNIGGGIGTTTGVASQNPAPAPAPVPVAAPPATGTQPTKTEGSTMADQDLSGDNLKYVRYWIKFEKPDLEELLEENTMDLVNYPTDEGSYGGLRIARFMRTMAMSGIERPRKWKDANYPPQDCLDAAGKVRSIPEEDEKYVKFGFKVEDRDDKQPSDYDRRKTKALEKIADRGVRII